MSVFYKMTSNQESSLTTPTDRDLDNKWRPDQTSPPLTKEEGDLALKDLNNDKIFKKYPRVDRTYADPPVSMQNVGLFSFIPAKGATPNEKGFYGFAKLRGNFATEIEAQQRSEYLVRNVDSYHQIFHTHVGRPFPLTEESKYSAEVDEIDLKKQMTESISTSIKKKKQEDEQEIRQMKEREEEMLKASERAKNGEVTEEDEYDNYITMKVKKAQLTWTYLEHMKKMEEIEKILVDTRITIEDVEKDHPDYQKTYFDKYKTARKDAGIDEDDSKLEESFMKYLVEDFEIPKVEKMYQEKLKELASK